MFDNKASFPTAAFFPWAPMWDYAVDCWQRNVLFLDVMRQRGNDHIEHAAKPVQHVLEFDFELVMDGRELPRPANYALVRIVPPDGMEADKTKRPFVIVDPRAGHGPGIGGFKPDSEIGAAIKAGHPCYFIGFATEPVPGQTLEDVGLAEITFIKRVAELHSEAEGKPCLIGNCQAGWAVMMLASVQSEAVGPLLIAGAPLSYWAGVRGKNPMRYLGGLLGGTWLSTLAGDVGNGTFDGAYLVDNFEKLNPANTLWSKQYNLWSKIDTEGPRYLGFERWWGGHTILGADEMQTIADELFVGNKLVKGEIQTSDGKAVDLRNIKSPIVIFCSHGDNITPPQQALHWIVDLYDSVEEIRAYGQTIVYAIHETVGHLGIFVSSSIGRKEHDQFTQNMDLIDVLPPGLYEAVIREKTPEDVNADLAAGDYVVTFERRTLDDIKALGELEHEDERTFETVSRVSDINQGLYRTWLSPLISNMSTDQSAAMLRELHPARMQYKIFSDQNPLMSGTKALADQVRANRKPVGDDNPFRVMERQVSDGIVSWLNLFRDMRDDTQEQLFFGLYGSDWLQALVGLKAEGPGAPKRKAPIDPAREALVHEKIRDLKRRFNEGGEREAAVRAMLYVGLPEGRVDERAFGALKVIHDETPEEERISFPAFKQLLREQFYMLLVDQEAALAALPDLLPKGEAERQELFECVLHVTTAAGKPSEARQAGLRKIAELFGLDPKVAVDDKLAPRALSAAKAANGETPAAEKPAAAARRRTTAARPTTRRSAAKRA